MLGALNTGTVTRFLGSFGILEAARNSSGLGVLSTETVTGSLALFGSVYGTILEITGNGSVFGVLSTGTVTGSPCLSDPSQEQAWES